jgi:calmodulin
MNSATALMTSCNNPPPAGMIPVSDFREVMLTMGDTLPREQVDEMIRMCDIDGDGQINYENFVAMVSATTDNLGLLDI